MLRSGKGTKRNIPVDICFLLDTTHSMQSALYAMINKVSDLSFDLRINNRHADIKYGAVVFRDPVDWMPPPPSSPVDAETNQLIKESRKRELMDIGLWDEELENLKEFYSKHVDKSKYPEDQNVAIEFDGNIEKIMDELMKVECGGGNDDPEDWNGAIRCALNMNWRENSKKCIIIISDANAHGKRFCGYDNHNDEEDKLIEAVEKLAEKQCYIIGISVMKRDKGCLKTLQEMKDIYETKNGKCFIIEEFKPIYDENFFGEDNWPQDVFDEFMNTIRKSMSRLDNFDI